MALPRFEVKDLPPGVRLASSHRFTPAEGSIGGAGGLKFPEAWTAEAYSDNSGLSKIHQPFQLV